jgi:hypothetical protein
MTTHRSRTGWCALIGAVTLKLAACGGGGGGGGESGTGTGAPTDGGSTGAQAGADYYPLAVGDRWLYADTGGLKTTVRVTGTQAVGGGTALVVQTADNTGISNDLYLRTASAVMALPAVDADPITAAIGPVPLLRLPITAGDRWVLIDKSLNAVEDLDGDGRADTLAVHAEATVIGFESLTTAAGTYTQVAHVQTVITQTAALTLSGQSVTVTTTSDDWYAPDIGPVRNVLSTIGPGTNIRTDTGITAWGLGTRRSESVAPTLVSKSPDGGSVSGVCCVAFSVAFSEPMDTTVAAATVLQVSGPDSQPLAGSASWQPDGLTAVFAPSSALTGGTYSASVTTAAQDLVGNALATASGWQFSVDASGPGVTPVQPLANATEVPLNTSIVFTLDEDPDPATVSTAAVFLVRLTDSTYTDIGVSLSGRTVTLTPRAPLQTGARYQVTVTGITDRFGNHSTASWIFSADPGRFAAAQTLIGTAPVTAVAVGDVDGDGRADTVMATGYNFGSADDFTLFVFRSRPDGTLAPPQRYSTVAGYGSEIMSLVVADLDGQGRNAVIAASSGNAIQIFRRQGDGSLASSQTITTPASYVVRVADVNGDGRPDFVGRPFIGSAVQVWTQAVDGSFGAPLAVPVVAGGYGDLAVGDINGDGRNDIVITSTETLPGQQIGLLLQQPDGSFATARYLDVPGDSAQGVAIGDVNGDGRNDLVVALGFTSTIGVMLQDAQGQLGTMTSVRAATNAMRVQVADIDGDGRLDVVSSAWGGWPLALNRQRSDGTLGGAETFPVADYGQNSPGLVAVGDVDGDGLLDIVYGRGWLRQRPVPATAPPAPARTLGGLGRKWGLARPGVR